MRTFSRREFTKVMTYVAGGVMGAGSLVDRLGNAEAQRVLKGPVNWMCWSVNLLPEVMRDFANRYGASINPINFEDNAEGFIKLRGVGGRGFDVAQSEGTWARKYFDAGLIEPLNLDEFPSAKDMYPQFKRITSWVVPEGKIIQFAHDWSPAGILYVKGKVPAPSDWNVLWDSKYKGRITMSDKVEKSILLASHVLNIADPLNMSTADLERCRKRLIEAKPLVKAYLASSSDVVKAFVSGEAHLGVAENRGIVIRIKASGGPDVGFVVPKRTHAWVEGNMLVKNSEHRDAAIQWIDYFNTAEVQFALAQKARHAIVNQRAIKLLKEKGLGWLVDILEMEHPERVDDAIMVGPPRDIDGWVQAWNEVKAS